MFLSQKKPNSFNQLFYNHLPDQSLIFWTTIWFCIWAMDWTWVCWLWENKWRKLRRQQLKLWDFCPKRVECWKCTAAKMKPEMCSNLEISLRLLHKWKADAHNNSDVDNKYFVSDLFSIPKYLNLIKYF